MTESVLFVCAQNICRSPLMAAVFEAELGTLAGESPNDVEWIVGSAGTEAEPGRRSCRFAVSLGAASSGHRSSRLETDDLHSTGLVITASLAERALVAQLLPSVRTRTFTLREALLLGESSNPATTLAEYADGLDSRRGTLDLPRRRALLWQRDADRPLDVIDVHPLRAGVHRRGLQRAAADARSLAALLKRDISVGA